MIDLYTKVILTVIAVALSVNVFVQLEFVGPVHAADGLQKVQICDQFGCANVKYGQLAVSN
ncbi:hypothetical protein GN241_10770 [Rhodobacteraceae bacterium IMCC1335]